MTILGIDISLTSTGITCVIARDGVLTLAGTEIIRTKPSKRQGKLCSEGYSDRCEVLIRGLISAINDYRPQAMAIELPSGGSQSSAAAMAQGACFSAYATMRIMYPDIPWIRVEAWESKLLAGDEKASKAQVAEVAYAAIPGLEEEVGQYVKGSRDDVTDAAAAILVAMDSDVCKAIAASEEGRNAEFLNRGIDVDALRERAAGASIGTPCKTPEQAALRDEIYEELTSCRQRANAERMA